MMICRSWTWPSWANDKIQVIFCCDYGATKMTFSTIRWFTDIHIFSHCQAFLYKYIKNVVTKHLVASVPSLIDLPSLFMILTYVYTSRLCIHFLNRFAFLCFSWSDIEVTAMRKMLTKRKVQTVSRISTR